VLASCAVILGSKKAPGFLKKHGIKSALLQGIDKKGVLFEVKFGPRIIGNSALETPETLKNA
jgi:hypothetical protein